MFSRRFITISILAAIIIAASFWYFAKSGYTPQKPTAGQNIIAFGDSLVAGSGAAYGNDFVSILSGRIGLPIINAGKGGDTTKSALGRLDRDVLSNDPHIVIVLLGGNDAVRRIPKEEIFQNLAIIIDRIQEKGAAVLLLGIRGGVIGDGFKKSFGELAKEKEVFYVPRILDNIFGNPNLMADRIHPNDQGYEMMADRIEPVLVEMLE